MIKLTTSFLKISSKWQGKNRVVDFIDAFSSAKSILLLMPDNPEEFEIAHKFLKHIERDFFRARILYLIRDSYLQQLNEKQRHGTIFVAKDDINPFGLPKRKLKHKIMATHYDIVIDLNQNFHPLSTYLCRKTDAALKVCLENQEREPFYNFSVRTQIETALAEKYKKLLKYLRLFIKNNRH
ncbi:MAG TPA: hypothetical protein ENN22_10175 [bacterium]|nr:hypothetical protein [bacterium]